MDNNLFYETDIKIRFDNSNYKNDFLGVAGDSETRKLNFSVFDSEGVPVSTDFPVLKLLVKGEYDGAVYYSIAEKKQGNEYSVVVPSQIFKQKQTVKMQFVIEDKERKKKIYTSIIEQKVAEGLCSNAVEGTNIYIDYDEIKEFETKFSIFVKQLEETKNEIDEDFKGLELKINNLEELMLEEVEKAIESITADVQIDLNTEKDKIILEISGVGEGYKAELEGIRVGSLGEIKEETVASTGAIGSQKNIALSELTQKHNEITEGVEALKDNTLQEVSALSDNTIRLITSEQTQAVANIKEASNTSLAEIKKQSEAELKVIEETRDISVAALDSKKVTCIQQIETAGAREVTRVGGSGDEAVIKVETATSEATKTIEDKILELDTEKIMQRLNELETLITGFDDRIKANTDTIAGHSEEIKSINDSVLVHQTDIDTVTDDLNKKI